MTARTARRISQPDSRCVPNRNAVLNKKNVVALPPLPLAQLHPRNALPRVYLAATIRKAGRCLTAPLPRRHSAQALGVSTSASCRAPVHAQKLIHGSAIKCHGKPRWVNNLQNSNRR